jgi:hypothetical protein
MIAQHLLVPIDFTEHSESALNYAQEQAVLCKARLTLVHVIETPTFTVGPWGVPVESYLKEMDAQLRQMLDKYVESAERAGVMCEAVIRTGRAYQAGRLAAVPAKPGARLKCSAAGSMGQSVAERCPLRGRTGRKRGVLGYWSSAAGSIGQ